MDMSKTLTDVLRALTPAGEDGFEGLIANLLATLTGSRFALAKSGSQRGRDISSRRLDTNVIAVECKRYAATALPNRELLGELDQAIDSIPDLDIWVLVASRDIDSILAEELFAKATKAGVLYIGISLGDGQPSSLEVLCAQAPDAFLNHPGVQAVTTAEEMLPILEAITALSTYNTALNSMRANFLSPLVGYDTWRQKQNSWLITTLSSERESRAHFHQILNVADPVVTLIDRPHIQNAISSWYDNWKTAKTILAVSGDEGDGKTWSVATWLHTQLKNNASFPTAFLFSSTDVIDSDVDHLFSHALSRQAPLLTTELVHRRINRWKARRVDESDEPLFVCIFDGINERSDPRLWRTLLSKLLASPWIDRVAILVTCRSAHWKQYYGPDRSLSTTNVPVPRILTIPAGLGRQEVGAGANAVG
jgi:hypothetical protein